NITVTAISEAVAIDCSGWAVASANVNLVTGQRPGLAAAAVPIASGTTRTTTAASTMAASTGTANRVGSTTRFSELVEIDPRPSHTARATSAATPTTSLASTRVRRLVGGASWMLRTTNISSHTTALTI